LIFITSKFLKLPVKGYFNMLRAHFNLKVFSVDGELLCIWNCVAPFKLKVVLRTMLPEAEIAG